MKIFSYFFVQILIFFMPCISSGQEIEIFIKNYSDTITDIEPLTLAIDIKNNSDKLLSIPNLFWAGADNILIKKNRDIEFKTANLNNMLMLDNYISIDSRETLRYSLNRRDTLLKLSFLSSSNIRLISEKNQYEMQIGLKYFNHEQSHYEEIYSNIITFYVVPPKKEDKKVYKYLKKRVNPEQYLGASWHRENESIEERIKHCEYMLSHFNYSRLLAEINKTYFNLVKSLAVTKIETNKNAEQQEYYVNYIESFYPKIKDQKNKILIKNNIESAKKDITIYKKMQESRNQWKND